MVSAREEKEKSLARLAEEQAKKDAKLMLADGAESVELVVAQGKNKHNVRCLLGKVLLLKQEIESVSGISVSAQKLIWRGKQLQDDDDMKELGLKNGNKMLLMLSSDGLKLVKDKQRAALDFVQNKKELDSDSLGRLVLGCND